jgi:hypothetical protein
VQDGQTVFVDYDAGQDTLTFTPQAEHTEKPEEAVA